MQQKRHRSRIYILNTGMNRHQAQEREANSFAIELLIPPEYMLDHYLDSEPDLAKVVDLASDVKCSREAAVRRFVEKHPSPLAVVFSKSGQFRYCVAGPEFGWLALKKETIPCRRFLDLE